jgi:beta-glucosidase/6-phospho-beta-glucosidase/beta-galactosidase
VAAVGVALLLLPAAASARAFPKDFQWGVANAGFQVEGGQGTNLNATSDWWLWTHDPQNIATGTVTSDRPEDGPGFWTRHKRDVRLAARNLNLKAFRMSVEWSRVFPTSTVGVNGLKALDRIADRGALRRYRRILREIRAEGMTPWVTLNHFVLPSWIHDPIEARDRLDTLSPHDDLPDEARSGWLSRTTVGEFRKYSAYLAWKLGPEVDRWITLNEPMVVAVNGYANIPTLVEGNFPPGAWTYAGVVDAIFNMADANAVAYKAVKRQDPGSRVGFVHNMVAFTPKDPNSADDQVGAQHAEYLFDRLFMDAVVHGIHDRNANGIVDEGERNRRAAGRADFVGLNYYFRGRVTKLPVPLTSRIPLLDFLPETSYASPSNPVAAPCPTTCTEFGWEIYPEGLRQVLKIAGSYGLPVIITENGISDSNDDQRAAYLTSHLRAVRQSIRNKEADVRGYFQWSLVDNFEWAVGYTQRFGLFGYDPATLARIPRPSAKVYGKIARTGNLP